MAKKTFTLAQVLSITTQRLCCKMDGVYEILNHVTGDELFTHQLPRASRFAGPLLLEAHPELVPANACLGNLDGWISRDRTRDKAEGVKMWLTELRMMFPTIRENYEIESRTDAWLQLDPVKELAGMVGPDKVVVMDAGSKDCMPSNQ